METQHWPKIRRKRWLSNLVAFWRFESLGVPHPTQHSTHDDGAREDKTQDPRHLWGKNVVGAAREDEVS